jgi:hypothetical protein
MDAIRRHPWRTVLVSLVVLFVLLFLFLVTGTSDSGTGYGPMPG